MNKDNQGKYSKEVISVVANLNDGKCHLVFQHDTETMMATIFICSGGDDIAIFEYPIDGYTYSNNTDYLKESSWFKSLENKTKIEQIEFDLYYTKIITPDYQYKFCSP